MKTDGWSTDHARSLTKNQWTDELSMRFMDDICREITSLAVREPVRLALEQHSLEALGDNEHSNWKIYNVSISGEISFFFVTAYFWQVAPPWQDIESSQFYLAMMKTHFQLPFRRSYALTIKGEYRLRLLMFRWTLTPWGRAKNGILTTLFWPCKTKGVGEPVAAPLYSSPFR